MVVFSLFRSFSILFNILKVNMTNVQNEKNETWDTVKCNRIKVQRTKSATRECKTKKKQHKNNTVLKRSYMKKLKCKKIRKWKCCNTKKVQHEKVINHLPK